ncbi:hypothetical protein H0H93_005865 [Arthromyces matolae]|nr:hypothetical protein H0H93_005865 [Arthromyces matolae]
MAIPTLRVTQTTSTHNVLTHLPFQSSPLQLQLQLQQGAPTTTSTPFPITNVESDCDFSTASNPAANIDLVELVRNRRFTVTADDADRSKC